jgi:LAS seventeen-binding protein 5
VRCRHLLRSGDHGRLTPICNTADSEGAGRKLRTALPEYVKPGFLRYSSNFRVSRTGSFADAQLTDALKNLQSDPNTNEGVKKKLTAVLASWHSQFKDDPGMAYVANLYKPPRPKSTGPDPETLRRQRDEAERKRREDAEEAERKRKEDKDAAKRRAEELERERWKKADEERAAKKAAKDKEKNKGKAQPRRRFVYEVEKPKILESIATASQASSNLVNAITVNVFNNYSDIQSNAYYTACQY